MDEVVKSPLLMRVDKLSTELSLVRDELDDAFPQDQSISYEILSQTIPQKEYVVKVAEFVPSALTKDSGGRPKSEKKSRPTTALSTRSSYSSLRNSLTATANQEREKTLSTATSRTSNLEKSRYLFQKIDDELVLEEKIGKNSSRYKYGRWYIPTERWGSGEQSDSSQSTDTQTKLDFDISKLYSTQIYKDYLVSQGKKNLGILSLLDSSPTETTNINNNNNTNINPLSSSSKVKSSTASSLNTSKKIPRSGSKGNSLSRPTTVSHGALRRENLHIRTPLPKSASMSSLSNSNTTPPLSPQPSISPRPPNSSLQRSKSHHFPNKSSHQPLVAIASLPSFQARNQNLNARSLSPNRFLTVDNSGNNNNNNGSNNNSNNNNNNTTSNSTGQPSEVIGSFTKVDLIIEDQMQVLFEPPRSPSSRSPKNTYRKSR